MKIDRAEARRIADLAHLEFDDAGLDRLAAEMSKILEYIDQLKEVDLTAPAGTEIPGSSVGQAGGTPMRDDEGRPATLIEAVERNAPAFAHGHFVVPKVIGGHS